MYEFDMNNNPDIRRIDYEWQHWSAADVRPMKGDQAVWDILDSSKTLEEQIAIQKQWLVPYTAAHPKLSKEILDQIDIQEIYVPGINENEPQVRVNIIKPKKMSRGKRPAVLNCYGGGMILGCIETTLWEVTKYVTELNVIGICFDYRLIPEHPYPAAVNDAEAVLNYILANADELHINPERLIVEGMSAGAYVATCLAQRLKLKGGFQFAGEMLVYPLLDDTFSYPSSNIYYGEVWHPIDDQKMFEALMGPNYNRSAVPVDAIPGHCKDFRGMPPTCIIVGDLDYGHDPAIAYAQGLMNAGIFCDLHVWGGGGHGFMGCPSPDMPEIAARAWDELMNSMKDLMTGKLVRK